MKNKIDLVVQGFCSDLEKDAARYRWLRSRPCGAELAGIDVVLWVDHGDSVNDGYGLRLDALDSAIDQEMLKENGTEATHGKIQEGLQR